MPGKLSRQGQSRGSFRPLGLRVTTGSRVAVKSASVAVEGDLVTVHWKCINEEGVVLENSRDSEEGPTTFEVGAGDIVGNRLFEAFDAAVRGMAVGDVTSIKADGGDWNPDLLFKVPVDHTEVQRLQGRYKNQGGLREGMVVELSNGGMAVVIQMGGNDVVLDANNMLAGKMLSFELELINIAK